MWLINMMIFTTLQMVLPSSATQSSERFMKLLEELGDSIKTISSFLKGINRYIQVATNVINVPFMISDTISSIISYIKMIGSWLVWPLQIMSTAWGWIYFFLSCIFKPLKYLYIG